MKDFIRVTFEDYNLGKASQNAEELFCPLEIQAVIEVFLEMEGWALTYVLLTVYMIQICEYKVVGHWDPL